VPGFETQGLDHVAIAVADLDRSSRWYRDVLGLERVHEDVWGHTPVMLMQRGTGIALFRARGASGSDVSPVRILHFAFRVDRASFDAAQEALRERGIEFEFQDHVVSHSIYARDPDGHQVELTTYEI
jgi:catechol 2,3-dioxygenase-like lactoylglutathione lyase family enzyme